MSLCRAQWARISLMPCRALEAFRPQKSHQAGGPLSPVLMPCRALEAFRQILQAEKQGLSDEVLMPCRALEAFRHSRLVVGQVSQGWKVVLMPCRALEAFRRFTTGLSLLL